MPNPQVALTQTCIDSVTPKASDGTVQAVSDLELAIDDYTTAYAAKYPAANGNGYGFIVVPKNMSQVGTKTVTITATGKDLQGNSIPPQTQAYDIVGPPPPPPATSLTMGSPTPGAFSGVPPDPGSATVKLV